MRYNVSCAVCIDPYNVNDTVWSWIYYVNCTVGRMIPSFLPGKGCPPKRLSDAVSSVERSRLFVWNGLPVCRSWREAFTAPIFRNHTTSLQRQPTLASWSAETPSGTRVSCQHSYISLCSFQARQVWRHILCIGYWCWRHYSDRPRTGSGRCSRSRWSLGWFSRVCLYRGSWRSARCPWPRS